LVLNTSKIKGGTAIRSARQGAPSENLIDPEMTHHFKMRGKDAKGLAAAPALSRAEARSQRVFVSRTYEEQLRSRMRSAAVQSAAKIIRAWRASKMTKRWTKQGVLLANLYFERDEIEKLQPKISGDKMKVEVFGEFEGKHGSWNKRYECPYDDFFLAYKC